MTTNEHAGATPTSSDVQDPALAAHNQDMPALITAPELVDYLRLPSLAALYKMRERGDAPPAVKIQKALLFRRDDVDTWLATKVEAA
jgi:predicted DNA-binding transcriptional regulator AlpA